jgi:hypothetical protein
MIASMFKTENNRTPKWLWLEKRWKKLLSSMPERREYGIFSIVALLFSGAGTYFVWRRHVFVFPPSVVHFSKDHSNQHFLVPIAVLFWEQAHGH